MKILVKSSCTQDMDWGQYFLIELDAERIAKLDARRLVLREAHAKDADLWMMEYWDCPGDFYDGLDLESLLTKEQQEQFDKDEFIVLPDDFKIEETDQDASEAGVLDNDYNDNRFCRTDCRRLIITEDGFFYKAIVKHTDCRVETRTMNYMKLNPYIAKAG